MFRGQIILNYSKTYRISFVNKDILSLAVTSQTPSPVLTVSKSEGESLFIMGQFKHEEDISIWNAFKYHITILKECFNTDNS